MTSSMRQLLIVFIATSTIAAILVACSPSDRKHRMAAINSIAQICREGDIVLREGCSMESRFVKAADRHSSYTHCGIVARMGDSMVVVHAVPNEPDFKGDVDRVKAESVQCFFARQRARGGCLLRCNINPIIAHKSAMKALQLYRRHTLFDGSYDGNDTTMMYCSELVEFVYQQNGMPLVGTGQHNYNLPGIKLRNVILPSDFLKSAKTKVMAKF